MGVFADDKPLTDAELDRLDDFLMNCSGGDAMNLEELDGFFSAMIAGPDTVMPSEYLPEVFGGELCAFETPDEASEILGLLMRHWNSIAKPLSKGDVHVPLLLADENGVEYGNDWALGFMCGMQMRHDGWNEIVEHEERLAYVFPMMMLFHEHDDDPEMRPEPISPEQRETIIVHMAAGVMGAYRYFREGRRHHVAATFNSEPQRTASKVGRNDPCPCGSGKKYKKCCGGATVN
jgi:uncharacterized protein